MPEAMVFASGGSSHPQDVTVTLAGLCHKFLILFDNEAFFSPVLGLGLGLTLVLGLEGVPPPRKLRGDGHRTGSDCCLRSTRERSPFCSCRRSGGMSNEPGKMAALPPFSSPTRRSDGMAGNWLIGTLSRPAS